jgi:hypothetical protein
MTIIGSNVENEIGWMVGHEIRITVHVHKVCIDSDTNPIKRQIHSFIKLVGNHHIYGEWTICKS